MLVGISEDLSNQFHAPLLIEKNLPSGVSNVNNITFNSTYAGLAVYSGSKAIHGLNISILKAAHALVIQARETMRRPVGFHILINEPTEGIKNLDQILSRWGEQMGLTSKPLYLRAHEIRPVNKQRHLHLHVIADMPKKSDVIKQEIDYLLVGMRRKNLGSNITIYKRKSEHLLHVVDKETGELRPVSSVWFHDINREASDYFLRLSYLAKVFTKNHSLRNWSCSNLKNRQHYTTKQEESKKITTHLLNEMHRKSNRDQPPTAIKSNLYKYLLIR